MDSRLFWLALAAFVGAVEGGLIAGQLPLIGAEMGVTIGQAGLLVVGYSLAYAVGTPVLAVLLGGVGRRRVAAGAELALAVCALLLAVAPFFEWMVAVRTLLAVAAGTFTGTAMATAAMLAPPGQRGRYMQVITIGPVDGGADRGAARRVDRDAVQLADQLRGDRRDGGGGGAGALPAGCRAGCWAIRRRCATGSGCWAIRGCGRRWSRRCCSWSGATPVVDLCRGDDDGSGARHRAAAAGVLCGRPRGARDRADGGAARRPHRQPGDGDHHGRCGDRDACAPGAAAGTAAGRFRLPLLLLAFALHAYTVWTFSIAVQSQLAHLAPSSVPVAISLNMSAFNIAMAIAAAAGGVIVDTWGAQRAGAGGGAAGGGGAGDLGSGAGAALAAAASARGRGAIVQHQLAWSGLGSRSSSRMLASRTRKPTLP